jgi:hypothetical protein
VRPSSCPINRSPEAAHQPPELVKIESAITFAGDQVVPCRGLDVPELLKLRKLTQVRFALGHRYLREPILVELRWPRPNRALDARQGDLIARWSNVVSRDADQRFREIYFFASLPLR